MTANTSTIAAETKADPGVESFQRAFAAFRETNDERLAQIDTRLSADVLTEEKLARIDRTLDETKARLDAQALERARPKLALSEKSIDDTQTREHKAAFRSYMKSGEVSGLKALEGKAMTEGSGPDGGYLVPIPAEREIMLRIANISPIRSIATVRETSTSTFRKAYSATGPAAGWVAEADARPQSANQQIADLTYAAHELYAMPAATQTLLDDAVVDVEQWIATEVATVFAEQEGMAFVNGTGVNQPKGFLTYPQVQQANWSWGNTGYIDTGVAGDFPATFPSDILFSMVYALRAGYRQNGRWVMNRKSQSRIRTFKTTTGEYLWAPPTIAGGAATLMNFPVVEAEAMPDIAPDATPIAFGDFMRGYLVVDRVGIRVLRDPYSSKPYVLFYTTKRVGGGMQDFEAIKLLKFGVA